MSPGRGQGTPSEAAPPDIARAAALLRRGGLVAFPTETIYGLGADATSADAVARIYAAKARPHFNPLIAHVATRDAAEREGVFSPEASRLASRFWPGPLTIVVPRSPSGTVCDLARAGLESIALRIPDHATAMALLTEVGRPLAAPSANRSGRISPTEARHVVEELGTGIDLVLDGGPCPVGVESTIVSCLGGGVRLLRPGGVSTAAIEALVGPLGATPATIVAPGMLSSHYAPRAEVRLDAVDLDAGDLGLDFGGSLRDATLDLSRSRDLTEAAANLYRHLRDLDARGPRTIAVAPVPMEGIGYAINDRLRRAAAPRG